MRRILSALVLACFLPLLAAVAVRAEDIAVRATPLLLDGSDPARTTIGSLEWRGGIAIASDSRRFGGLSGMLVENGGRTLHAISDVGQWLTAELRYDAQGFLVGMERAAMDNLLDPNGEIMASSKANDAESLTRLKDGRLLVGFERDHRVLVYPAGSERQGQGLAGKPLRFPTPPGLEQAPNNDGLEALATLPDGRVLAVSEDLSAGEGLVRAWIGAARGADWQWQTLSYRIKGPFRPTGAASLPNGDVVLTERAFNPVEGVRVRVMRIRAAAIVAGGTIAAEELAYLAAPVVTENLESVDALALPDGRIGLWILGDDNFNKGLQRTVLLHFVLKD
ncbi:MAG: esterase-like activity of phytase family protein [Reyranellaceae bacterium]